MKHDRKITEGDDQWQSLGSVAARIVDRIKPEKPKPEKKE